jgi:hypothetical protein
VTAPLFAAAPALTALPVGLAFGFALERAGLGSARTIADQLSGRDFTVFIVMFSAIVTAMLGVFWADRLGWLDLSLVAIPTTDLVPQLAGGIVFGAGFAFASLCPGTACVSAARGTTDGLVTVGGLFAGTLLTSELWPRLGALAEHAPREAAVLPHDLGLPAGIVVALIAALGVGAIAIVERRHGAFTRPAGRAVPALATIAVSLGALAAFTRGGNVGAPPLAAIAGEIAREADHVDVLDLAQWIHDGRRDLRVIDVREGLEETTYRIPGARAVPLARIADLEIGPGETVVLYSDGGAHAAQAWVLLRARGERSVFVLKDGLAAWEDEVLAPAAPAPGDTAGAARYQRALKLTRYFGGRPRRAGTGAGQPAGTDSPAAPARRRRNTC